MSSWKKAAKVNQKTHRERHQPQARESLGFLEKKKDYVRRAKDFNQKKKIIKKLKNIALNKNPDEFYHHMIRSKIVNGRHVDLRTEDDEHTAEQAKLMQHRNYNYVTMKKTIETKKIDKIQSALHMTDIAENFPRQHIYFDTDEPESSKSDDITGLIPSSSLASVPMSDIKHIQKEKKKSYTELVKRIEREKQLQLVQRKMEIASAREKQGKGKCVRPGSKSQAPIYMWKYERKR